MSRAPWESDHDRAEAERRLRAAFPHLREVRYFDEGWDFRAFLCDDGWLFRVPKRPGEVDRIRREVALLKELRLPVAVPRYEHFDGAIGGYRMLPGTTGSGREAPASFPRAFGAAMRALHDFLPSTRLPVHDATPAQTLTAPMRELEDAAPFMDPALLVRCRAVLDVEAPPPYDGPAVLTHSDLFPEHVLLDGDLLSGLIDWGDAGWGDPAWDFAICFFWGGDALLRETLRHYGGPPGVADRARVGGRRMAVGHIAFGSRAGRPAVLAEGLRALDRLGL